MTVTKMIVSTHLNFFYPQKGFIWLQYLSKLINLSLFWFTAAFIGIAVGDDMLMAIIMTQAEDFLGCTILIYIIYVIKRTMDISFDQYSFA